MTMVTFKNDASLDWNLGSPVNDNEAMLKASIGNSLKNSTYGRVYANEKTQNQIFSRATFV